MRRTVALCLSISVMVSFSGCASYTQSAAPIPKAGAMPAWQVGDVMAVGADPYMQNDRQRAVFDKALNDVGVLPIQVLVQNRSERRLRVEPYKITLTLPDGSESSPVTAYAVASRFAPHYGRGADYAAAAFGLIGAVVALSAASAAEKASTARTADYASKELKETILGKDESVHGFVFFMLSPGTQTLVEATLKVLVLDADDEKTNFAVSLPLRGVD